MPAVIMHSRFFIVLRKPLKDTPSTEPGLSSLVYIATPLWRGARLFEHRRRRGHRPPESRCAQTATSSECWVPVDQSRRSRFARMPP